MLNNIKKNNKGFTIIEVMIVLAIAGLIILIVLLAVPALQRNGRNTSIKNDASAVAAGISEYASNNDGTPITYASGSGTSAFVGVSANDANKVTIKLQGSTTLNANTSAATPGSTVLTAGVITVYVKHTCAGVSNTRASAVWYSIEQTGASKNACIDA
ncbi:MAG: hypothetical protein JWN38_116 [Candidatus Saccharibacteria bacterium]|nr:hypothetical protein [Candidatus Saccharibacteria bacterium]